MRLRNVDKLLPHYTTLYSRRLYFVIVLLRYLSFEIYVFRISKGIKNAVTWAIFFYGGEGAKILRLHIYLKALSD